MPIQASISRRGSRFSLSLLVSTAVAAATDVDYRRIAHDHYFNLEYDQAISAYRRLLRQQPNDPTVFNHIASAILFRELLRLGLLESSNGSGASPTRRIWHGIRPELCWRSCFEAAEVIQVLINDFPRNYVLHLELAAMHRDSGQKENALAVFRSILTKNRRNEPGYDRMARGAVEALRRKIKKLEAELDQGCRLAEQH